MTCHAARRIHDGGEAAPIGWIASVPVRSLMRQPVVTVRVDLSVRAAAALMRERGIRHLPVVDAAGRVVGIVTERDLLDALRELLGQRVVRPRPAVAAPGGAYDPGVPEPADPDPWHDLFALD